MKRRTKKILQVIGGVLAGVLALGAVAGLISLFSATANAAEYQYIDFKEVDVHGDCVVRDGVVTMKGITANEDNSLVFAYEAGEAGVYEVSLKAECAGSFTGLVTNETRDPHYSCLNLDYGDDNALGGYSNFTYQIYMNRGVNEIMLQTKSGTVEISGIRVKQLAPAATMIISDFDFVSQSNQGGGNLEEYNGAFVAYSSSYGADEIEAPFTVSKDGTYDFDLIAGGADCEVTIRNSKGDVVYFYDNPELLPVRTAGSANSDSTVGSTYATQYIDLGEKVHLDAGNYTITIKPMDGPAVIYAALFTYCK